MEINMEYVKDLFYLSGKFSPIRVLLADVGRSCIIQSTWGTEAQTRMKTVVGEEWSDTS